MRVIVCGSRGWDEPDIVFYRLAQFPDGTTIVVGYDPERDYPPGADRMAYQAATKLRLEVECHPALWNRLGKRAGFIRNGEMAESGADLCLAFWDGKSPGTLDMVTRAETHQIPVETVRG